MQYYENKTNILLVEDDAPLRILLQEVMEQHNYQVRSVSNGKEALEIYLKGGVDLVVSDIFVPDLNGLEFAEAARKVENTPFILMTGGEEPKELTGEGFLRKPFRAQELIQMMTEVLKNPVGPLAVKIDSEFSPLELEGIEANQALPFSLFVRLHAGKFVKITQPDEELTAERIQKLKNKGVRMLYKRISTN